MVLMKVIKGVARAVKLLTRNKSAAQLVEEGLLLSIALFLLAVILGTIHNVNESFTHFFDTVWTGLNDLGRQLFGWLWGG